MQERTYKRFFGLLAQRFCYVNRAYSVRPQCKLHLLLLPRLPLVPPSPAAAGSTSKHCSSLV